MSDLVVEAQGIGFGESVRWHDGTVWFADWTAGEILSENEVVTNVSSLPISFDWLADGRMVVVSGSAGRLLIETADGTFDDWVDLRGENESPWNEIAIGPAGVYVNCIGGDFSSGDLTHGIIALVGADGSIRRVADGLHFPNGMVVSGSRLIVAESHAHRLTAFDVTDDGTLVNRRLWAEVDGSAPDGISIDAAGTIWFADVPNRRCVGVREGGEIVRIIDFEQGCFSCAIGGDDGRVLYVASAEWPRAMRDPGSRTGKIFAVDLD